MIKTNFHYLRINDFISYHETEHQHQSVCYCSLQRYTRVADMSEQIEQQESVPEVNSVSQETPSNSSEAADSVSTVLPLEIIDRAIGKQVHVILTSEKEFKGTLVGFDDFVNMVLENVEEVGDSTGERRARMLLNGGHVAMIVPS